MSARFSRINLLPKDSYEYSLVGKTLKWLMTIGRALVVLTEFVVILAFGSRFYYDKKLNDLTETIDQKQAVVESYKEVETKIRDVLVRQKAVSLFLKQNIGLEKVVSQLKKVTPRDVNFLQINLTEISINVVGTVGSEAGFNGILRGIGTLPGVKEIVVGSVDFDQRLGLINFKIRATISSSKGVKS